MPPATGSADDGVIQIIEKQGYQDFGLIFLRVDYGDDELWGKWSDITADRLEEAILACEGGHKIVDVLAFPQIEDVDSLANTGFDGAISYYEGLLESGQVEPGFATSMVLVVDKAAMQSALNPVPGQKPWVWAVDSKFEFKERQQPPSGDPPKDQYPGYFRVTPAAAFTDLWPLLKRKRFVDGVDVWNPDVQVWDGAQDIPIPGGPGGPYDVPEDTRAAVRE
ncbi:hypothetical protein PWT90_04786 [Aphanocladium album]|nr:hypothetical protein PWT90_04786 [Aphanocladium album]